MTHAPRHLSSPVGRYVTCVCGWSGGYGDAHDRRDRFNGHAAQIAAAEALEAEAEKVWSPADGRGLDDVPYGSSKVAFGGVRRATRAADTSPYVSGAPRGPVEPPSGIFSAPTRKGNR